MTVREWFRLMRAEQDGRLWNDPSHTVTPQHKLLEAIRVGTWVEVEFWLLLRASELWPKAGVHVWAMEGDRWVCQRCGAWVPSEDIDETEPPPTSFDVACRCRACLPCEGVEA